MNTPRFQKCPYCGSAPSSFQPEGNSGCVSIFKCGSNVYENGLTLKGAGCLTEVELLRRSCDALRAEMDRQAKRANDWQWCCDLFCDFCSTQPMPPDSLLDKAMAMRADLKAKERGV